MRAEAQAFVDRINAALELLRTSLNWDVALRRLDELIRYETGVPVHVADEPLTCIAQGAGAALDYIEVIERALPTEEESLIGEGR